jgi:hypothetical protein
MKTSLIVAEFDVPGNILSRLLSRRVSCPVNTLDFQRGIERFRQAVVETYPGAAHSLADPQPVQDSSELAGSVIAAAAGMKNSPVRKIEVPGG